MTRLAIHFHDGTSTIVCNVTMYFLRRNYWHVRTLFGNCPEERMYDKNKIKAIFEVEGDDKRRII